ncbi:polysaccharide pyruvyl transferase family protein [Hungatella sp.]|uniref:polysaccharide pyruvyl transferase family protein n=1 Tax=Hungatella sp. TaxID=2613924 RepID=UPI002A8410A5|nr:polysaccharide pyruvyl transferase family protein [Hungatella sp.]
MKSVGIVTFFKSYNYGVWLQAYATQTFFEKEGYKVQIINYANKLEMQTISYFFKEKNRVSGYITSFVKSILFGKVKYYKKGFANHINEYYKLSPNEYTDISEMDNVSYDILVAGSDQLWNPHRTYGDLDPVFLLQFGKCDKRISLSTSLGSDEVRVEDKSVFATAFKKFSAISVREDFARNQLRDLCDIPIKVILDPTFLLNRADWLAITKKRSIKQAPTKGYILTYFVSPNKRSSKYCNIIKDYSRILGVPVLAVQFSRAKSTPYNKMILGASISDFIYLIENSTLMITDSFHGVALSVNLGKEFVAIENKENPERVKYLLNNLGLIKRIDLLVKDYYKIEYDCVNEKLDVLRKDSRNWIIGSI